MKEIVAHPDVDHGSLGRNCFHRGVGIDAGHHGQEAGIAGADEAGAAVVFWAVQEQPRYGVVGVGTFVDGFRAVVISERTAHDELAFTLVAATNIFANVDVAVAGQLRTGAEKPRASGLVNAVRGALDQERNRGRDVRGPEDNRVELDAVAHGDHDLSAHVSVEEIMAGQLASAGVNGAYGIRGERDGIAATVGIERKAEGFFGIGDGIFDGGGGLELGGNYALALKVELAVQDVDAERCVGLNGVSVLAGEGFDLADFSFGSLRGVRGRPGQSGREENQCNTESG